MLKPNSQVTTNLIKARELIADEKNWCQHGYQLDGRICAATAVSRAQGYNWAGHNFDEDETYQVLKEAANEVVEWDERIEPEDINDGWGHAKTIEMFDRAIELSLQEHSPEQPR